MINGYVRLRQTESKGHTYTNPEAWPVPHACAKPYHPGSGSHGCARAWGTDQAVGWCMCAPCFKFVLYAMNIIKVHLKGTSSSLLKGNIRQMKNNHRCKAYQKGNTRRNKNALTAAFSLASSEIISTNEEAINSTRNGIYSLKDFYFLLYRRRYLYLFLNWFSTRVKYVRSQAIRVYKYTATSWLCTSVAKDLNSDDREQMQWESNPGIWNARTRFNEFLLTP